MIIHRDFKLDNVLLTGREVTVSAIYMYIVEDEDFIEELCWMQIMFMRLVAFQWCKLLASHALQCSTFQGWP